MSVIQWERYPTVAQHSRARTWLTIQANLELAGNTIEAYGRALEDYLTFSQRVAVVPDTASREHIVAYVHDLATGPHRQPAHRADAPPHSGLANATLQQRLTVVRLYYDYLVEEQLRDDNPVGRGHYTPSNGFHGTRARGLIPHYHKLPWLPTDDQ